MVTDLRSQLATGVQSVLILCVFLGLPLRILQVISKGLMNLRPGDRFAFNHKVPTFTLKTTFLLSSGAPHGFVV